MVKYLRENHRKGIGKGKGFKTNNISIRSQESIVFAFSAQLRNTATPHLTSTAVSDPQYPKLAKEGKIFPASERLRTGQPVPHRLLYQILKSHTDWGQ